MKERKNMTRSYAKLNPKSVAFMFLSFKCNNLACNRGGLWRMGRGDLAEMFRDVLDLEVG